MARLGVILFLAVGVLSSSGYGYELQSAKQFVSKLIDKATSFVGKQKQNDLSVDLPENAHIVELSTNPVFECRNDGLFSYPQDCTLGVLCNRGKISIFTCTDILHFNNVTKRCEDFCSAHCDPPLACYCGWDTCETSSVQKQKQNDLSADIPENAHVLERSTVPSFDCRNDGLFSYPQDCTLGILCRRGEISVFTCTDVLHFNNYTKRCEDFCSAHCDPPLACPCGWDTCERLDETSTTEETETNEIMGDKLKTEYTCRLQDGLFADPMRCNQYIRCVQGEPNFRSCPPGLHFSKKAKRCDTPCNAKCDPTISCRRRSHQMAETPTVKEFTASESKESSQKIFKLKLKFVCQDDGLFPAPNMCYKYINCSNGVSYEMMCPLGLHFNSETKRCEFPCSAKCDPRFPCSWRDFKKTVVKESQEELCSRDGSYLERNPLDCKSFFRCEDGDGLLFQCEEDQHFNPETLLCEQPCDARCEPSLAEKCGWDDTPEPESADSLKQPIFDFTCEGNGLYENPHACENFIQCAGGHSYLINCPYGQHYSSLTQRCTAPCEARCAPNYENFCTDEKNNQSPRQLLRDFDCETDGYHANPLECESFIQCFQGSSYAISCPPGLHYSPTMEICMTPCEAKCVPNYEDYCRTEENSSPQSPRRKSIKQPFPLVSEFFCTEDGIYSNPGECTSYIECMMGQSVIRHCPEGLHFSEKTQKCESACDARCDYSIGTTCGWHEPWTSTENSEDSTFDYKMFQSHSSPSLMYHFTCMKDGLYKNPENCSTFIQCSRGHSYLMDCPEGLHFNEVDRRCDYICDARCNASIACACGWETCNADYQSSRQLLRDFNCEKDGYHTNPVDCGSFIQCFQGSAYAISCPTGLHYSPTKEICMTPCDAKCAPNYEDYCRTEESTYEENDCESDPEVGPCRASIPRYYYEPKSGRCRGFYYGGCGGNKNNYNSLEECENKCQKKLLRGFKCPESSGKFGNSPDCMSYYHCKRGIPTLKRCPQGKAFDYKKSKCVTEYEATCLYECKDKDAAYAYKEDCHQFIDCVNGISKLEKCPSGKAFDAQERDCIDEKEVSSCVWPTETEN